MYTRGEYTSDNVTYGVMMKHTKQYTEALLIISGSVVSAYKIDSTGSYSFNTNKAKEMVDLVLKGVKGCTSKNGTPMPFQLGALQQHEFTKAKVNYIMQMYRGEVVGAYIQTDKKRIEVDYADDLMIPDNIPYIKLTSVDKDINISDDELDSVPVRSVQEIALEKEDVTWLQNKKYYIVNDDETAEKLFTFFESYKGIIAYDTETTGLKINCFGKIGSHYADELKEYNDAHPKEKIRADRLVGIIFCVEKDVSYYFPCYNRKFKNLYEDVNSTVRQKVINNIRARYTVGDRYDPDSDMYRYIMNTPDKDLRLDVILMERVRDILEKCKLVAHNGTFECKVGYLFDIMTNIVDDTIIMHQLMYKFRGTTRNAGSPSNLKYLSKYELGIDQWELKDFFPNYKEDKKGTVRERVGDKKVARIDFSYMDYDGTRVYAPTDGDCTLQLYFKYKEDLVKNHKELEYLYNVELIVSQAIAYMEFYGHRIDESKIMAARDQTIVKMRLIESEIRQAVGYSNEKELELYAEVKKIREQIDSESDHEKIEKQLMPELMKVCAELKDTMDNNQEHPLNLSAPGQVADLFFNKLGYPLHEDKPSVAKKVIKGLLKEKNEDGSLKCPVAKMYSNYKNEETLLTKFFGSLDSFMYPGGFVFSSYGQIATATGRMSCIEENQYVTTVGGSKKIKDVKPGDLVYCYDDSGKIKISRVLNVINKGIKDCVKLNWVSKGSGKTGSLICTPDHKIKIRDHGWVQACNIEVGDRAYHITRSNEDRPRIYGVYGFCEQEQILIKKEYFKADDTDIVVHHIDENTRNNDVSNLTNISIDDDDFIATFNNCKGSIRAVARHYGMTFYKVSKNAKRLGLAYNHTFTSIENVGKKQVYDLEIEGYHNFIANEICVHNCNKPNAQQYPKVITKIVIPRDGYIMTDADYSQIEYRVLTALAKNEGLAKLFADPDSDYHTLMASMMYEVPYAAVTPQMRSAAKSFNFGIPYGMGLRSLSILLTGKTDAQSLAETQEKYEQYFKNQPETRKFFDNIKEMAQIHGYTKTLFNRYRYYTFTDADGSVNNAKKAAALRQAGNAVIQGCVGSDTKIITKEFGEVAIKDVVDTRLHVWDGDKWSNGDILYSGKKRKCIITFENGQRFICSPIHKFRIVSTQEFVECQNLKSGDLIEQDRCKFSLNSNADIRPGVAVSSVEITDEYIDMYDVCNTDDGYYVADGLITHNTAADVFKISVARNFSWIKRNKLLGKVLISNMVHDEQLMEIDVQHLNAQRALAEIGQNMQFDIEGFPPLYIGAGVGKAWGYAKGKMAEIHPLLLKKFTEEAQSIPLWREDTSTYVDPNAVVKYFDDRVLEFRRMKVYNYLRDQANWGKDIHPAIGGLVNLQFNYGRGDDAKAYTGPNGEKYTDSEFLLLNIADFIKENKLDVDYGVQANYFVASDMVEEKEAEEDVSYDDNDDFDPDDIDSAVVGDEVEIEATKIDESGKLYGSSIHDMIDIFGVCLLDKQRICGIKVKDLYYKKLDALLDYLSKYICDEEDASGYELVFLKDSNILNHTGVKVKGLSNDALEKTYKAIISGKRVIKDSDYTEGDVKTRSQAK